MKIKLHKEFLLNQPLRLKNWKRYLLLLILNLFSVSLFPYFLPDFFRPNFVLYAILIFALKEPEAVQPDFALPLFTGFLADIFSPLVFGFNALLFTILFGGIVSLKKRLFSRASAILLGLVIVLTLFYNQALSWLFLL